jgi:hypothetical protein
MNGVCAAKRVRSRFGKTQITHFPGAHQICHRADRILDWRVRVYTVLIIKVDDTGAEAPQTCIAGLLYVLRLTADSEKGAVFAPHHRELGSDDDLLPPLPDRTTNQFLIAAHPIHVSGVEKRNAQIDRTMDGSDRFRFITRSVEIRHAHTTKPEGGHGEPAFTKLSCMHRTLSSDDRNADKTAQLSNCEGYP